ncbi:MAG: hypothetical protein ABSF64_27120 [Bryobacteraceae bacterium]|jgi:hypothetical protein
MTDAAFVMPLVFLFCGMKGAHTLLGDGDTGWHLRTGEWILAHGRVPRSDIFSFTRSGQPWFAWEWLWDVLFGWLHLHAGMAAVVLASSLILALTFALLFRMARRSSDALVALAITLVAAAGSAGHWLARPHLFTMLFTVVFYSILERTDREPGVPRRLWMLAPLMVLWTNLHGGFFVGILLIGAYAAGQFAVLLRETGDAERRLALRRGRRYLFTAAACGAATLINPYVYRLHAHIFQYLSDGFYRGNIMEFQSLNFQSGQARYFEILLAAGAAAALWGFRRGRLVWPLLFAVWAHLALYSARNVEIFVLLAATPAAEIVSEGVRRAPALRLAGWLRRGLGELADFTHEWNAFDGGPRWYAASMVALLALGALVYAPQPPSAFRASYDPKSFPVAAAVRLEKAGLYGGVFTEDLWGGYLIYREYPRGRVFIDGRSDFYGAEFAGKYIQAMGAMAGWEPYLSRYGVETVLLPPDAPLAGALRQSSAWRLIYDDGVALIFRSAHAAPLPLQQASAHSSGGGGPSEPLLGRTNTYDEVFDPFLERRPGPGPDRIHPHASLRGVGFGSPVCDRRRQHQYHLVGHQFSVEHRGGFLAPGL